MIVGSARLGRYEIERHIASGGMAEVYLARDPAEGRAVALKIPHDGEEIWEAERAGAALQVELAKRDARVPDVYEIGSGAERFVAMEYVEGVDLSRRLQSGPLDWREATAIAIELCGVLTTARSCGDMGGEAGGIVHGDIKPRNIRVQDGGRIQVLDFGIARALRHNRAETRNLYGSVPYSSPERLDRGHVDYQSDLWSVAVVLYEMLEGERPFRAASDHELERAIRSHARPARFAQAVPPAFTAVVERAFAAELSERYTSAAEMESDLRRILAGESGVSEATRRTLPANGNGVPIPIAAGADVTRRTGRGFVQAGEATAPAPPSAAPVTSTAAPPAPPNRALLPRWLRRVRWRAVVAFVVLFLVAREFQALGEARNLRSGLASRPRGEGEAVWREYRDLTRGHPLVFLSGVGGAVRDWMVSHADDLISRYRSDTPTLYETGWRATEILLQHAVAIDPGNRRIQARLEFCRAHLLRIAARDEKQRDESMSRYDEAVSRFERAARLWPDWGDPHIGLAQIYAYGKFDPERTAASLDDARKADYPFGERETALLGDAYRLRAERRWAGSTDSFDNDQLYRHLMRVRDDCTNAVAQYEQVPSYPGVGRHLRALRQRLEDIDVRLGELSGRFMEIP